MKRPTAKQIRAALTWATGALVGVQTTLDAAGVAEPHWLQIVFLVLSGMTTGGAIVQHGNIVAGGSDAP